MKTRRAVLALGLALALGVTAAGPAEATEPDPTAALLRLINDYRASHGRAPLVRNAKLDTAALAHTRDMAAKNYFAHDAPDGTTLKDRLDAAGYDLRFAGENLAGGQETPTEALQSWKDSPGHDEILLTPEATEAGLAYLPNPAGKPIERLWTLVVARPR